MVILNLDGRFMEKAKKVFKCISVFAATYCALLNAVVADNRYFKVFAVLGAVFCAVLLAYAFEEKAPFSYKASYSVLYFLTVISVIAGLFGSIDAYRCGALLLILLFQILPSRNCINQLL